MFKIGPFIVVHKRELHEDPENSVDQIRGAMMAGMTSAVTPLRDDIAKLRMEIAVLRSELPRSSSIVALIDEAERVILAEQQATGRTLSALQWAVDQARMEPA